MKKSRIYLICIILFIAAVAAIVFNYSKKEKENKNRTYSLLPRKGQAANTAEWKLAKKQTDSLLAIIKEDPTDTKSNLRLASLYIQEARVSGNYKYYDIAALKHVNNILKEKPNEFTALVFKSLIYLSQHHFADGLATAHKAQQINPYNNYVYGLLVDGNVEMGNYDSAVTFADKMVAIRPDLTSYSRVSYLREIFGDYKGAIQAMKMAAEAGGQGDEHTEWTRVQLAGLYEKTGDFTTADSLYQSSLFMRPNYPYAIAGLGRVALAGNDHNKAIAYFEKADSLITDYSVKEELVDVYRLTGQNKKADEAAENVIEELSQDAQVANTDESLGHYADRELAYAYLKVNNKDKALEHALAEYNRRPQNIDVNETVAWVYYNRGEYAKAVPYAKAALKTNSKNPVLLTRAGLIFYKAGDKQMAKNLLQQVPQTNSYVSQELKAETLPARQDLLLTSIQ
ncbi:MAG: tetratricopeptide repeat protein [Segetibacter sp.]|nr:tetratricopeptide repeat protein [Segetibacter sp.]